MALRSAGGDGHSLGRRAAIAPQPASGGPEADHRGEQRGCCPRRLPGPGPPPPGRRSRGAPALPRAVTRPFGAARGLLPEAPSAARGPEAPPSPHGRPRSPGPGSAPPTGWPCSPHPAPPAAERSQPRSPPPPPWLRRPSARLRLTAPAPRGRAGRGGAPRFPASPAAGARGSQCAAQARRCHGAAAARRALPLRRGRHPHRTAAGRSRGRAGGGAGGCRCGRAGSGHGAASPRGAERTGRRGVLAVWGGLGGQSELLGALTGLLPRPAEDHGGDGRLPAGAAAEGASGRRGRLRLREA